MERRHGYDACEQLDCALITARCACCNGRPLRTSFRVLGTGNAEVKPTHLWSAIITRREPHHRTAFAVDRLQEDWLTVYIPQIQFPISSY